jgi:hypothetical protein
VLVDAHSLAQPFEAWKSFYSHSTLTSTVVLTTHLGAMFLGGGIAVAADRTTLRVSAEQPGERARQVAEMADVHRPVLIGITLLFVSGIALALSDLENFLGSPVFWIKLSLVALLLINGAFLQRTESTLRSNADGSDTGAATWKRMRTLSILSIALWIATFLAGSVLTNAS